MKKKRGREEKGRRKSPCQVRRSVSGDFENRLLWKNPGEIRNVEGKEKRLRASSPAHHKEAKKHRKKKDRLTSLKYWFESTHGPAIKKGGGGY